MTINQNDIGKQFTDTLSGATVTLVAIDPTWQGGTAVYVCDRTIPNPSNIPGMQEYWLYASHLRRLD